MPAPDDAGQVSQATVNRLPISLRVLAVRWSLWWESSSVPAVRNSRGQPVQGEGTSHENGQSDVQAPTPVERDTLSANTDRNAAQATLLIAALRDHLDQMIPILTCAEHEATYGRDRQAEAIRLNAAQLRRDVSEAQFLIVRLQRQFPGADNTESTAPPGHAAGDMPDREGTDVHRTVLD
jgi:hypothetical protein